MRIEDYEGVGTYESKGYFYSENEPEAPLLPSYSYDSDFERHTVIVSEDDGEFVTGEYSGTCIESFTGANISVSGEFKVRLPD